MASISTVTSLDEPLTNGRGKYDKKHDRIEERLYEPLDFESGYKDDAIEAAEAIARVWHRKGSSCSGKWLVRSKDGLAISVGCRTWACIRCSPLRRLEALYAIEKGLETSQSAGHKVRFLTLTDGTGAAAGGMDVAELFRSWKRLSLWLARKGKLGEYAASLELTQAGALHYHILMAEAKKGGGFILQSELSDAAVSAGFGSVVFIEAVSEQASSSLAHYLTKGISCTQHGSKLASYIAKAGAERLGAKANVRLRPFRFSRGWGSSLGEARKELAEYFAKKSPDNSTSDWRLCDEKALRSLIRLKLMKSPTYDLADGCWKGYWTAEKNWVNEAQREICSGF